MVGSQLGKQPMAVAGEEPCRILPQKRKLSAFSSPFQPDTATAPGNESDGLSFDSEPESIQSDGSGHQGNVLDAPTEFLIPPLKRRKLWPTTTCSENTLVDESKTSKRKFRCTFAECDKAYTKQSRLEEHERSHSGERPFVCSYGGCEKSFFRDSHLVAHARSHRPESDRPYMCEQDECEKRFWTSTQLKRHHETHSRARPFKCESCDESFAKHHQRRTHFVTVHCTPGTKRFQCPQQECEKSFDTNQKLKMHQKTHNEKRYCCVEPTCLVSNPLYFPSWTALQDHIRSAHPPMCTECGKTFPSSKALRSHLKLHTDRESDTRLQTVVGDTQQRRGGHSGRDWMCEWEECSKAFKSAKALVVHVRVEHEKTRAFICDKCQTSFGYKHLLQRHVLKHDENMAMSDARGMEENIVDTFVDTLTGKTYSKRSEQRDALTCPWPYTPFYGTESGQSTCQYTFYRAYDLRRHLQSCHNHLVEKAVLARWAESCRQIS